MTWFAVASQRRLHRVSLLATVACADLRARYALFVPEPSLYGSSFSVTASNIARENHLIPCGCIKFFFFNHRGGFCISSDSGLCSHLCTGAPRPL